MSSAAITCLIQHGSAPGAAERALEAVRETDVVGVVASTAPGTLDLRLVDVDGALAVPSGSGIAPGPGFQEFAVRVGESTPAHVHVMRGADEVVGAHDAGDDSRIALDRPASAPRVWVLDADARRLSSDLDAIADSMLSDVVTVVPIGDCTVIVAVPRTSPSWPSGVAVTGIHGTSMQLLVGGSDGTSDPQLLTPAGRMQWYCQWAAHMQPLHPGDTRVARVEGDLGASSLPSIRGEAPDRVRAALAPLLGDPLPPRLSARLALALDVPEVAFEIAAGTVDPARLPSAQQRTLASSVSKEADAAVAALLAGGAPRTIAVRETRRVVRSSTQSPERPSLLRRLWRAITG